MPTPGGPDQGQDHAGALVLDLPLAPELAHGQVLEDALLDVLQAGVVGLEDLARGVDVVLLVGDDAPRHVEQPVEVGADRRALGPLGAGLEATELALGLLAGLLRQAGLGDALAVARDLVAVLAGLAELLADRVELAAQQELALALLHALGDVVADAALQLEVAEDLAQPRRSPSRGAPRRRASPAARASAPS